MIAWLGKHVTTESCDKVPDGVVGDIVPGGGCAAVTLG